MVKSGYKKCQVIFDRALCEVCFENENIGRKPR